jgi:hypothetical protein
MPNIPAAKVSIAIASERAFAGFKYVMLIVPNSVKATALLQRREAAGLGVRSGRDR